MNNPREKAQHRPPTRSGRSSTGRAWCSARYCFREESPGRRWTAELRLWSTTRLVCVKNSSAAMCGRNFDALVPKLDELEATVASLNANVEEREGRISNFEDMSRSSRQPSNSSAASWSERDRRILALEGEVERLETQGDEARRTWRKEVTRSPDWSSLSSLGGRPPMSYGNCSMSARRGSGCWRWSLRTGMCSWKFHRPLSPSATNVSSPLEKELTERTGQADELRAALAERDLASKP